MSIAASITQADYVELCNDPDDTFVYPEITLTGLNPGDLIICTSELRTGEGAPYPNRYTSGHTGDVTFQLGPASAGLTSGGWLVVVSPDPGYDLFWSRTWLDGDDPDDRTVTLTGGAEDALYLFAAEGQAGNQGPASPGLSMSVDGVVHGPNVLACRDEFECPLVDFTAEAAWAIAYTNGPVADGFASVSVANPTTTNDCPPLPGFPSGEVNEAGYFLFVNRFVITAELSGEVPAALYGWGLLNG